VIANVVAWAEVVADVAKEKLCSPIS
jgi:hypothetical protein